MDFLLSDDVAITVITCDRGRTHLVRVAGSRQLPHLEFLLTEASLRLVASDHIHKPVSLTLFSDIERAFTQDDAHHVLVEFLRASEARQINVHNLPLVICIGNSYKDKAPDAVQATRASNHTEVSGMAKPDISQEYLHSILHYDPDTGVFTNKVHRSANSRAGDVAGSMAGEGYLLIGINKRRYLAHRLAWFYIHGVWPDNMIDHIDGVRHNNALNNLRQATNAENLRNQPKQAHNTSGYKGVTWKADRQKYRAYTKSATKQVHLGYFDTAEEAHAAYCKAIRKYHGEFSYTK